MIISTSPSSGETYLASEAPLSQRLGRRLLRYGIVLFLLGLATGRLVQSLPLPRMGLSSHLQGVMNGAFIVVLGLGLAAPSTARPAPAGRLLAGLGGHLPQLGGHVGRRGLGGG